MVKFADRVGQVPVDVGTAASPTAPGPAARRELLDRISDFLLDHALDVNPANLIVALEVASGSDTALSRQIAARQLADEPVTQDWLDGLASDDVPGSGFAIALEHEARAACAAGECLSIALCDIDRLTAINASHGRDTGDRVIQAIARTLQRICGEHCHVTRLGGEDFALLLRGLKPDEAANQLNQAREKFAQRKLIDRKTHLAIGSVTFSAGVADALGYSDPQAALEAADKILQAAKEQGRNRILVAREPG